MALSEMIKAREATKAYHRMPIGYGPFPGPRQDWWGKTRLGTKAWTETQRRGANVTFKTPKAYVETLLPHESFSFETPGDEVYCTWAALDLQNLGWLEGRGYIHDVTVKGETETVTGDYLTVLYEGMADPVTSGREELGTAKLYAELSEIAIDTEYTLEAKWEGFTFIKVHITGLKEVPIGSEKPKTSFGPSDGILHYKYIPATGRPGFADAEYPCITPFKDPPAKGVPLKEAVGTQGKVTLDTGTWHNLPTMHHVVDALSKLKVKEIVDSRLFWQRGSDDIPNQRAVN
ncbi:hypothetical protein LTR72_010905 [Exophiala xenobiotica]|nr:hypothetical protein LTR72_010905 [Exophiala xenobiotica]KAK5244126.1 hypothetical protein LTS06_010248 [Exophiala xenobiotica]KAK5261000.1 hypothetical protein LTR40_003066 [Exophiala xenobiotica]KAK5285518.1 hypothetical protein LTR14_010914 [Exophiala xenobiotica]KAK5367121.1 hypothetical protein LTS13_007974 [Exophiala xenobiotica]